jgi:hypothetical protein
MKIEIFSFSLKNALAYYNAGVVNSKVGGLAPGFNVLATFSAQGECLAQRKLRSNF